MENISEKLAYLRGLADGMAAGASAPQRQFLDGLLEILCELDERTTRGNAALKEMANSLRDIGADLESVEGLVYDGQSPEQICTEGAQNDQEWDDDEFVELVCPACGCTVYFDPALLHCAEPVLCPQCGKSFEDPQKRG